MVKVTLSDGKKTRSKERQEEQEGEKVGPLGEEVMKGNNGARGGRGDRRGRGQERWQWGRAQEERILIGTCCAPSWSLELSCEVRKFWNPKSKASQ